jgi:tRNA pseudouridine65 synthase
MDHKDFPPLEIIYQDKDLIAINKPHGLLVHRTKIAADTNTFALQLLRDQIGQHVYPVHRLDRKTSGVLLFALNKETQSLVMRQFREHIVSKAYIAIVRGYAPKSGIIDYELTNDKNKTQSALTKYKTIVHTEIRIPHGKHPTSRYAVVKLFPKTGRMHQLRKHMSHIFHPIIGDRPHGCNKQNRLWKNRWNMDRMMLHAYELQLTHPSHNKLIKIDAKLSDSFMSCLNIINIDSAILDV